MLRKKVKSLLCRIPLLRRLVPEGRCAKGADQAEKRPPAPVAAPAPVAPPAPAPVPAAPAPSPAPADSPAPPPAPAEVAPVAAADPALVAKEMVAETTEAVPEAPVAKAAVDEAKIKKHREKTKKAVLKQLIKLGGVASLADLHDFSEKKYFVAHRAFSSLMEEYVEESLLLWDATTGMATITDAGRAFVKG